MRLSTLYEERYEPLALRSRRPNTKRLYRATLKSFDEFLGRAATTAHLSDATVRAFAAHRLDSGLSKYTVNKDLFNLLALWRWLHKKRIVRTWPDVAMERPPVRAPVALTRAELAAVRCAIGSEESEPGPAFWLAIYLVIWDTGERIGAVLALTWDRVDLAAGWVRYAAEHRKGATADNVLPIAADTIAALAAIRRRDGKVFEWPYSATYIYKKLGAIMQRAGLPNNRLYKFHAIRKSVASHYEAAGGNATELLGHTSRKITRAYLDPRIVRKKSAIDVLFRPGEL